MQRAIVGAVRVSPIDHIGSFGRLVIPLTRLRTNWRTAQCDFVFLQHFAVVEKFEDAFLLKHQNPIDSRVRRKLVIGPAQARQQENQTGMNRSVKLVSHRLAGNKKG
jgi:hypothetical protein